jgi:class 3 adenylate cyclase
MSAVSLPAPAAAPVAPAAEPAQPTHAPPAPGAEPVRRGVRLHIPLVSTRIAGKIIAPYLVLILILALLAVYVVTRLVTNTINDRFNQKLQDSGHAANEAMVKLETEFLQTLRLMTNTEGVAEALAAQDIPKLEELILPLQVNAKLDLVDVFVADGTQVSALRAEEYAARALQMTDPALGRHPVAKNVLDGLVDNLGDKYTALVQTAWGPAIYASAPVKQESTVVGAILVGMPLEKASARLSREAQASVVVYADTGKWLVTTLPWQDLLGPNASAPTGSAGTLSAGGSNAAIDSILALDPAEAKQAISADGGLVRRTLPLQGRTYQELVGTLEIRGAAAAPMGVALPVQFIQEAAFASRVQLIAAFGIVVLGVLALGLSLARAITNPIRQLVHATEVVATGDLGAEVPVTTSDEVGRLTHSFNQMVAGLREREKIRNMFSQFVTGAVAEAVLQGRVKLGGERQDITVLMSDVRSFTTLSESLEAEALVSMLNRYFSKMIDAIAEYDGVLDKFLGDGIITEFNCPLEQDRHELRAVLTALRMREYLKEFNQEQIERGEKTIRIGIGVHSGPAVVGNVGAEGKKLEYTAMGDTVNVAARLESQTKEVNSDIVVSGSTYLACKDFVDVGEAMALHVKGRVEPVIAHKLVRLKPGLVLGPELITMDLDEVRRITAEHDDGGAGLYAAEVENSYNPELVAPPDGAMAAVAAG